MENKPEKKMFLQIVKQLRELIASQHIQEGQKLPSERVLSEQLQVGRSSVREASKLRVIRFDRNKAWWRNIFSEHEASSIC